MATPKPALVQDAEGQNPLAILQQYDSKDYNVLCPPAAVQARLGFGYVVSVEEVKVNPDPLEKEVYKVGSRPVGDKDWEDEVTFYGTTLNRFANAAGISYGTRRVDDRKDPDYVEFQAMAWLRKGDGTMLTATRTKGFDLKEIEREVIEQQTKKVRYQIRDGKVKKENEATQIRINVSAEMGQKRKHRIAICETGAILRVFRALIGMKSSYPVSALKKPFIVAHIDFRPDPTDPLVKKMLMERGLRADQEIFGSQGMLPSGSRSEITEVDVVHEEQVEIAETVNGSAEGAQTTEETEDEKAAQHVADLKLMEPTHQIGYISQLQRKKGLKQKPGIDLTKLGAPKRLEIILALEKLPDKVAESTDTQGGLGELFEGVE